MIVKFIFAFNWIFSFNNFLLFSKVESLFLIGGNYQILTDVTISDALTKNQSGNIPSTSLRSVENEINCISHFLNSSSNCTEFSQVNFDNTSADGNKEKETALPNIFSKLIDFFSADTKNASLYNSSVNTLLMKNDSQEMTTKNNVLGQAEEKEKKAPNLSYAKMIHTVSAKEPVRNRKARANTESAQSILKKIFPEGFFTDNPNSAKKDQKSSDLEYGDESNSKRVKYKNRNSSERKHKMKLPIDIFGENVYFRAEPETTTTTAATAAETPATAAETNPTVSETGTTSQPKEGETEITPATNESSEIEASNTPNVHLNFHFHIFGGLPTLFPKIGIFGKMTSETGSEATGETTGETPGETTTKSSK